MADQREPTNHSRATQSQAEQKPAKQGQTKQRQTKQRQTQQRQTIAAVLKQADHPLLPKELLARAQQSLPQLGIATVFRTLKTLVQEGDVKVVCFPGDAPRYERSDLTNHHFKCCECDGVFDMPPCAAQFIPELPEGFQLLHHEMTLFGRCADCSAHHSQ